MTGALILFAIISGTVGAVLFYLASPHQKMKSKNISKQEAWIMGGPALVISLLLFFQVLGLASAVFAWITLVMILWSLLPLGIAVWKQGKINHD